MPSEELDPTWVNSPPIIPDLINVERPILQMVATGSTLATIAMKDDAYVVEIWNVERGLQKVPVLRTTAPIKRPGRPHTSIGRSKDGQVSTPEEQDPPSGFDVGFAFSHDGRSLAQFWLNPDHAPPSLIYRLSIPEGGEWIAWPPPELTDDGLLVALRRTGANKDLKALLAFFNDNAPDDASRLFVDTPSNRSPDGTRSARFDVNDQRIHIFDNATGKEVCSFASGLNPNEYLERLPADRGVVDYRANGSAIWSSDGKMLIVRLEVACSYQWGHCSVPQAATSEHKLMVPEIHYDCLLFFNPLGQDWLLQEGTEEFR